MIVSHSGGSLGSQKGMVEETKEEKERGYHINI
jgi:hypothetical protein